MEAEEFNKALLALQTLIVQEDGISKLLSMIKKIKCQVKLDKDATATCNEVASMLKESKFKNPSMKMINQLDDEIRFLADTFIKINLNTSLLFQLCRFDLIKQFYEGNLKLTKLSSIGDFIQNLVTERLIGSKFKKEYTFMDEIVDEMQRVKNADWKVKCEEVALFMKYYGCCCDQFRDRNKSFELFGKATFLLETAFGDKPSCDNQLFPDLCHYLGLAYQNMDKLVEAKQYFEKADVFYLRVKDLQSENSLLDKAITKNKRILRLTTNKLEFRNKSGENASFNRSVQKQSSIECSYQ